jgi:hypothetical protein
MMRYEEQWNSADNIRNSTGRIRDYLRSKPKHHISGLVEYFFDRNHWVESKETHYTTMLPMKSCIPSKKKWHQPCIADLATCSSSELAINYFEHDPNSPSLWLR